VGDDEEGRARFLLGGDDELVEVGDAERPRPESGSSKSTISGSVTIAQASPARFFMPPDTSPGSFLRWSIKPTSSAFLWTSSRIAGSFLQVCSRSGKAMLS
jgi:hypothetical protein